MLTSKLSAQILLEYPLDYGTKLMFKDKLPYLDSMINLGDLNNDGLLSFKNGDLRYFVKNLHDEEGNIIFDYRKNRYFESITSYLLPSTLDSNEFMVISYGAMFDSITKKTMYCIVKINLRIEDNNVQELTKPVVLYELDKNYAVYFPIYKVQGKDKYFIVFKKNNKLNCVIGFSSTGYEEPKYFYDNFKPELDLGEDKYRFISKTILNNECNKILTIHYVWGRIDVLNPYDSFRVFISINNFNRNDGSLGKGKLIFYTSDLSKMSLFTAANFDAEFSFNDRFVYLILKSDLVQYDLQLNEFIKIHSFDQSFGYSQNILLGPDNRIYILPCIKDGYISCIPYPDKKGAACGFYQTDMKTSSKNFPNFIEKPKKMGFSYHQECDKLKLFQDCDTKFYTRFDWFYDRDSISGMQADIRFSKSGKYLVSLRASNKDDYKVWYSDTVDYIAPPKANFAALSDTGCQWVGFHFKNTTWYDTIKPGANVIYKWSFGDGSTDTSKNPIHIYRAPGNYTVQLIADNGFCSDTIVTLQKVVIKPAPKPVIALSASAGCVPLQVVVKNMGDSDIVQQTFYNDKGDSFLSQEVLFNFTKAGKYWIYLKVKGKTACEVWDSATVVVYPNLNENSKIDLACVSVMSNHSIQIDWQQDSSIKTYHLYRRQNEEAWEKIASISGLNYLDTLLNTIPNNYEYRLVGESYCGEFTKIGNSMSSIKLQAAGDDKNLFASMNWHLNATSVQPDLYTLFKKFKTTQDSFVELLSLKQQQYIDLDFFKEDELGACYQIQASYSTHCEAWSNTICTDYHSQLYIPNAFSPGKDGVNDSFEIYGAGIKYFEIKIYNRWGECVFTSEDIHTSWDGRFKEKYQPAGCYFYVISAKGLQGNIYRKGILTLF